MHGTSDDDTGSTHGPDLPAGAAEVVVDAMEEGDRPIRTGTAMAALSIPLFRRVFVGAFLSNIGTWMQNVVLGALAYDLTRSPTFVGVLLFAQLGPLLLFSMVGGLLADAVDRRRLLVTVAATQGLLSLGLAWVARAEDPSKVALVGIVFLIGVGQAVFGPTYGALLPQLVGRENLAGAISLNSAQMNGSRVVGPAIGSAIFARWGADVVFVINAASYLVVIGTLLSVRLPPPVPDTSGLRGVRRLLGGLQVARADRVVGRCLVVVFLYSLLSLPFIGQLPTLADLNLGIEARSTEYGFLYAAFGTGALVGALSIGTVLAGRPLERVVRSGLVAFAAFLAVFAVLRTPLPAYGVVFLVGLAYFAVITSLSTVLQQRLDDSNRGRVMALWMMGFGGTVPIGNLIAGPIIEATSITAVVLAGAGVAVVLAWYADLRAPEPLADPAGPVAAID
ncbi:MAG TPA: MFS transporter [Acidimicrobiales bacterium]|nr:MFS transporter [Acidimicrobiales bacterium]